MYSDVNAIWPLLASVKTEVATGANAEKKLLIKKKQVYFEWYVFYKITIFFLLKTSFVLRW